MLLQIILFGYIKLKDCLWFTPQVFYGLGIVRKCTHRRISSDCTM